MATLEIATADSCHDREGFFLLGTGPSSGIPQLAHVIGQTRPGAGPCKVCLTAAKEVDGPNRRNNISAVLCIKPDKEQGSPMTHILFEMGKTFRTAALRWFPVLGVRQIDALFLSHDHADAMGGLDDVRDVQGQFQYVQQDDGHTAFSSSHKMPVYLSDKTMANCRQAFSYIVNASSAKVAVARKVGLCDFQEFDTFEGLRRSTEDANLLYGYKIIAGKLRVDLLPMYHGDDYICMGFALKGLQAPRTDIVFLSDVSHFPEDTIRAIDSLMPIDTLIIDALFYSSPHFSHLCLEEALDFISRWRPRQTLFVGFSCRSEWVLTNEHLRKSVLPAMRDGTRIAKYDPPLARPIVTAKMLASIAIPTDKQPSLANIERIQIARDGIFIPFHF